MSCGVGCRYGSDPTLLWLWGRPVATALIKPLAWEFPYAVGAALEKAKRQKKKVVIGLLNIFELVKPLKFFSFFSAPAVCRYF